MPRWKGWTGSTTAGFAPIGNIPPAEAEEHYFAMLDNTPMAAYFKPNYLRQSRVVSVPSQHRETNLMGDASLGVVVYFNGTFVNRLNGAHIRVIDALRFLNSLPVTLVVYSYRDHPTCPWGEAEVARFQRDFPDIELVLESRSWWARRWIRAKLFTSMVAPKLFMWLAHLRLPGLTPAFDDLRARLSSFVLLANYAKASCEINGFPEGSAVIETHDISFLNAMKQQKRGLLSLKTWAQARGEMAQLSLASDLIAIAPPEAAFLKLMLAAQRTYYVPCYPHEIKETPPYTGKGEPAYDMLFIGSENVLNVQGITKFMRENAAWLRGHSLAIAGRVCETAAVRSWADEVGAHLLGFVEDLTDVYSQSTLVVSPVDGTGMKIKVVEALGAGKPVFGSQHTLDGLPTGYDHCVFLIDTAAIDTMLTDPPALLAAEQAALRFHADLEGKGDLTDFLKRLIQMTARSAQGLT